MRLAGKRIQSLFPGPTPSFISGNAKLLEEITIKNNFTTSAEPIDVLFNQYGDTFRLYFGPIPFLFTRDVELIKFVSTKDPEHFTKLGFDILSNDYLKKSIIFTEGKPWYRKRALMRNAFKKQALDSFIPKFYLSAQELGNAWKKKSEKKQEIEVLNDFSAFSMDIIGRIGFGIDFQCVNKPGQSNVVKDFNTLFDLEHIYSTNPIYLSLGSTFFRSFTSYGRQYGAARDRLLQVVDNVLKEREGLSVTSETKKDLLQYLIESSGEEDIFEGEEKKISSTPSTPSTQKYSNEELINEVMLFFVAGHETTSNLLSWTLYYLSKNPEIKQRVLDELTENNFSQENDTPPSFSQLNNLPYLTQVLKETLRLHPALSGFTRKTIHDIEFNGKILPANLHITCETWSVHRDTRHFGDNINQFNPDRFTADKIKNRHPYAWTPFAAGQRNCIGMQLALMEARTALSYLLPRFNFTPTTEAKLAARMVIMTSNNMKMQVQPIIK